MKLKKIASNVTELHLKDTIVLFSYNTPVAAVINRIDEAGQLRLRRLETLGGTLSNGQEIRSRTTVRHINKWLDKTGTFEQVDQSVLDELVK